MDITTEKIDELWNDADADRAALNTLQAYYDGEHAITSRTDTYSDGNDMTNRVANFCAYIVDMYVGALTSTPYQVQRKDEDDEAPWLDEYTALVEQNALVTQDAENLRTALTLGCGIELHEFSKEDGVRITNDDPRNWLLLWDSDDTLACAVYRAALAAGTVSDGELVADDMEVMTVYDAYTIRSYSRASTSEDSAAQWQELSTQPHYYGRVPVVAWQANSKRASVLTKDLRDQNDEYNEIDSASGDDIRYTVDAILALMGYDAEWLKANADTIQNSRMLPLAADGDAKFLEKSTNTEHVNAKLRRTRGVIHMAGRVPDIEDIVGTTGATSGIALKLKFMPMQNAAGQIANYIRKGMRERIELINAVWGKVGKKPIEDYTVTVNFSLPVNRIEEWQNIAQLDGVVSHRTQLELLTDVDNPEKEMERLDSEKPEAGADALPPGAEGDAANTPADLGGAVDRAIAESAKASTPSEATLAAMMGRKRSAAKA